VECNPRQGELLADVIKKLEAGETVEKEYYVEEQVFTRENIKSYINN
jgi:simple sugar transport system substrate-binding protein